VRRVHEQACRGAFAEPDTNVCQLFSLFCRIILENSKLYRETLESIAKVKQISEAAAVILSNDDTVK
jgi:hypothetical protein